MKWRNRIEGFFEYVLAALFIRGGINVILNAEPLVLPGIFTYLVGPVAILVYGALFLLTGLLMLYAKIGKRKRLHKHVLMTMYLTCIYVFILAVLLNGFTTGLLMTIAVGFVSAYLWLRWKIRTEYLDPAYFHKMTAELRDDLPPNGHTP